MQPDIHQKTNYRFLFITFIFFLLNGCSHPNVKSKLKSDIQKIIDSSKADVGVAVEGLDFDDSLSFNGEKHYPMQSVYKFPLAITVLQEVDKGKLSLDQIIHISQQYLDTNTWSPIVDSMPDQDIDIKLRDLLPFTVSKSDNNGCDALFRLMGGPNVINDRIHDLGVQGINIVATEAEMHKGDQVQYTNWCQPKAMVKLLKLFYEGKGLSKTSMDFLMNLMVNSENSPNRIIGLLPKGTIVAHKSGTSGKNKDGIYAATNDVGIVTLPIGKHYSIVVYVSNATGDFDKIEYLIARISRVVWDYFQEK